jgi:voltage-gated potassium channel
MTKPRPRPGGRITSAPESVLRNFGRIIAGVFVLVAGGTVGYHNIEGYTYLDSLYMTLITLSTVGYREIEPLSPWGKVFTLILITLGIGLFTFLAARLVSYIVEGEIRHIFDEQRRKKMLKKMKDHHIVCGAGRVGGEVFRELHQSGAPVVVIDRKIEELRDEIEDFSASYVLGDATESSILEEAGIAEAASLVTCLPNDADNVYICLNARSIRKDLYIIARANSKEAEEVLGKAGADRVISPYSLTGHRMALLCIRPTVTRFLDSVSHDFKFEEIKIPPGSSLMGKQLKESGIRKVSRAIVVAVVQKDGHIIPNPGPDTELHAEETLIMLGSDEELEKVERLAAGE